MPVIQDDGVFKYQLLPNLEEYLLGTNETNVYANGLIEGSLFKNDTVTIPNMFNNKPVTEIGQYAFTGLVSIKYIIIGSNVRFVHIFAFADHSAAELVYIPSSVEVLFDSSIYFWNNITKVTKGRVQIVFEANSNLKIVGIMMFHSKEIIQIFSPSIISPKCHSGFAAHVQKKTLYSPYSFEFCGLKSLNYFSHVYDLKISKTGVFIFIVLMQN